MIICSCKRITDKAIRQTVHDLLEEDPNCMLTPGIVYRAMGLRAQCGSCLSLVIELIIDEIDHPTDYQCQIIQLNEQKRKLRNKNKKLLASWQKIQTSTR